MATATPVKRPDAGASFTKAAMGFGLRQSQQRQCVSIWTNKHTATGCLA